MFVLLLLVSLAAAQVTLEWSWSSTSPNWVPLVSGSSQTAPANSSDAFNLVVPFNVSTLYFRWQAPGPIAFSRSFQLADKEPVCGYSTNRVETFWQDTGASAGTWNLTSLLQPSSGYFSITYQCVDDMQLLDSVILSSNNLDFSIFWVKNCADPTCTYLGQTCFESPCVDGVCQCSGNRTGRWCDYELYVPSSICQLDPLSVNYDLTLNPAPYNYRRNWFSVYPSTVTDLTADGADWFWTVSGTQVQAGSSFVANRELYGLWAPGDYVAFMFIDAAFQAIGKSLFTVRTAEDCYGFRCRSDGDCENEGTCDVASGLCACPAGFFGPDCARGCSGFTEIPAGVTKFSCDNSGLSDGSLLGYAPYSRCAWLVAPEGDWDYLDFDATFFSIATRDYLYVYQGPVDEMRDWQAVNESSTPVQTWGTFSRTQFQRSAGDALLFIFTSDYNFNGVGFELEYTTGKNPSNTLAVGLGVGLGVAFLFGIAALIFFLYKRQQRKKARQPPDFSTLIFTTDLLEDLLRESSLFATLQLRNPKKKLAAWTTALANPALWNGLPAALIQFGVPLETLAVDYMFLLSKDELSGDFLVALATQDLEATEFPANTFREDTLFTRCWNLYFRLQGLPWLWEWLAPAIREFHTQREHGGALEIDQNNFEQMNENFNDLYRNSLKLKLLATNIFRNFLEAMKNFPKPLLLVVRSVNEIFRQRFPTFDTFPHFASLLFLRSIGVAIVGPEKYGLLKEAPSREERRDYILLSKVLQNLANLVGPSTEKESFMAELNDFLEQNTASMRQFYEELAAGKFKGADPKKVVEVPSAMGVASGKRLYYQALQDPIAFKASLPRALGGLDDTPSTVFESTTSPSSKASTDHGRSRRHLGRNESDKAEERKLSRKEKKEQKKSARQRKASNADEANSVPSSQVPLTLMPSSSSSSAQPPTQRSSSSSSSKAPDSSSSISSTE